VLSRGLVELYQCKKRVVALLPSPLRLSVYSKPCPYEKRDAAKFKFNPSRFKCLKTAFKLDQTTHITLF